MKLFPLPIILVSTILFLSSCSKTKNESDVYSVPTDSLVQDSITTVENIPQPVINNSLPQNQGSSLASINPAHGEPGHRCDIPVGAPLNSQPASQNSSAPLQVTSPKQEVIKEPVNIPSSTAYSGKPNPAHGEPGHRCDIPVGQTLP